MGTEETISGEIFEQEPLRVLEAGEEGRAAQPGGQADQRGVEQRAAEQLKLERRSLGTEDGEQRATGANRRGGGLGHHITWLRTTGTTPRRPRGSARRANTLVESCRSAFDERDHSPPPAVRAERAQ
jgi:hypothetical protein